MDEYEEKGVTHAPPTISTPAPKASQPRASVSSPFTASNVPVIDLTEGKTCGYV
jgi:hypothetical protein